MSNIDTINKIFDAIPDVIKVYRPDHTAIFYNKAACEFYGKEMEEVYLKRCDEILDNRKYCDDCPFNKVIQVKKLFTIERYYPSANKYMNVCLTPVLDEHGDIEYIVERMTDITEKQTSDNLIRKDERFYREMLDLYPDAIVIIQDNEIALANGSFNNLINLISYEKKDRGIFYYMPEEYRKNASRLIRNILKNKGGKTIRYVSYVNSKNEKLEIQVLLTYIVFNGKGAVLSILRDETELRKNINMAAEMQINSLQKNFPIEERAMMEYMYCPAKTVSGDFFKIHRVSENLVVGVLADVSGNGVTAALNISAFEVLFLQEVLTEHNPLKIINNLNDKYNEYDKNYIAACCFSIDFETGEADVVGAGINQFLLKKKDGTVNEVTIKGPFIGMFSESLFEQRIIKFDQGDEFYFFTDGLEFIFNEDKYVQKKMRELNIEEFKKYIYKHLNDMILENGEIKDDSSMLAIKIK